MAAAPTDLKIFHFIGDVTLQPLLDAFQNGTPASVITAFTALVTAICTLHLVILGYSIMWGYVEVPFSTFLKTCLKYIIICFIAMNAANYTSWVVDTLNGLSTGMATAFSGSGGTATDSIYSTVDTQMNKGFGIAADMLQKAGECSWDELGQEIEYMLYAGFIAVATILLCVPAGGIFVIAKAALAVLLGIGPIFISCLLWPPAAKFFDAWIGQVLTYIVRIALVAAVLSMAFKGFETALGHVDLSASGDTSFLFLILSLIVYTIVMGILLKEAQMIAGQLAGGISSAAVTLRAMASPITSTASGVASRVNGPVTRRDMSTGQAVTASRFQQFRAGNTNWNPAYKQAMKDKMQGGGWGRAKGGSAQEEG